jgi:phage tail sheath protein FI
MALPTTLKTPGVYIDEKNAFPNSVVAVETAVPAFVGYTERAEFGGQSLKNKPVRIESFMEFELFYGKGYQTTYDLTTEAAPTEMPRNYDFKLNNIAYKLSENAGTKFNLYDSLKFFYQNGGGSCFIISVGSFTDIGEDQPFTSTTPFMNGIDLLKKETEPTMLVIPDAVLFDKDDCYSLQEHMLMHCGDQMNRVAILDIYEGDKGLDDPTDNPVDNFRNQVASDFLSYGAAYYPWLHTTIVQASEVNHKNLSDDGQKMLIAICQDAIASLKEDKKIAAGNYINLISAFPPTIDMKAAQDVIDKLPESAVMKAVNLLRDRFSAENQLIGINALPADTPNRFKQTQDTIKGINQIKADFLNLTKESSDANIKKLIGVNSTLDKALAGADDPTKTKALTDILTNADLLAAEKAAQTVIQPAQKAYDGFAVTAKGLYQAAQLSPIASQEAAKFKVKDAQDELSSAKSNLDIKKSANPPVTADIQAAQIRIDNAKSALDKANEAVFIAKGGVDPDIINNALSIAVPEYKLVIENILKKKNLLPPAAAMAGIYSLVDSQRGVWKAPANVAVSSVVSPAVLIDHEQQEDLNAPIQGKAICAIRPFIGLGTMVWGARTLDANSLDWRYMNVRRTMIMLEQSIKFAAKAYIFEPNVKNTWVSIESMIENFLTNLWKLGALAGAVPADAFSVTVGLGSTMTANDILEGRMNIEVRVAISHPAEFIVITFQQQQQKS